MKSKRLTIAVAVLTLTSVMLTLAAPTIALDLASMAPVRLSIFLISFAILSALLAGITVLFLEAPPVRNIQNVQRFIALLASGTMSPMFIPIPEILFTRDEINWDVTVTGAIDITETWIPVIVFPTACALLVLLTIVNVVAVKYLDIVDQYYSR